MAMQSPTAPCLLGAHGMADHARPYAILEAPSVLGLRPSGVEAAPTPLLELGLTSRIRARRAGRIETPPYNARRHATTLTLNSDAIVAWSPRLADAVGSVLERDEFPLILGGDCSILLGSMLALRRRGRYGLLYIDGHADFYQPEVNPNGEAASMDLAFATGYGPRPLTDLEGLGPLVRPADVVAFAFRDAEEQRAYGSQPLPPDLHAFDLDAIRRIGVEAATRAALEHLTRSELDGFFVHLDVDSLDDDIMPAVDYRMPGGLSWDELQTTLRTALSTDKATGMELTIYNPKLDLDGRAGRRLVEVLAAAFSAEAPGAGIPLDRP